MPGSKLRTYTEVSAFSSAQMFQVLRMLRARRSPNMHGLTRTLRAAEAVAGGWGGSVTRLAAPGSPTMFVKSRSLGLTVAEFEDHTVEFTEHFTKSNIHKRLP